MSTRKAKKARPAKKRRATNPRGGKPTAEETEKMTDLGYVTIAEAAKAVNRAASSIYERVHRHNEGTRPMPKVRADREPVVKTASGNVWVYLDSVKKCSDPVALATGATS